MATHGETSGDLVFQITCRACQLGPGIASIAGDCNDDDPMINPFANEVCDDVDNNCDGVVDNIIDLPLSTQQLGVCKGVRKECGSDGGSGWQAGVYGTGHADVYLECLLG